MARSKKGNKKTDLGSQPAMPVRYRCKVGGEWKPLNLFSKNQQQLIQRQLSTRGRVDAANCGMTCVEHSASFRGELRCELCCLIKPFDEFSKTMRKNDEPMCLRCTAWGETQEPGVTPTPLQTGHISVEEQNQEVWNRKFIESTDFFPDDVVPQAPITALSSLGISARENADSLNTGSVTTRFRLPQSSTSTGPPSVASAPRSELSSQMPPHLESVVSRLMQGDGMKPSSGSRNEMADETPSNTSQAVRGWLTGQATPSENASTCGVAPDGDNRNTEQRPSTFAQMLPPHLQRKLPTTVMSGSSPFLQGHASSISGDSQPRSISTATTMRDEKPTNPDIPYNAWDNTGKRHTAIKSPTESDHSAMSTSSNATTNNTDSFGGWNNTTPAEPAGRTAKSKWHKAPRIEVPKGGQTDHVSAQHINPGIDRQRRMRYCQTEDSNY